MDHPEQSRGRRGLFRLTSLELHAEPPISALEVGHRHRHRSDVPWRQPLTLLECRAVSEQEHDRRDPGGRRQRRFTPEPAVVTIGDLTGRARDRDKFVASALAAVKEIGFDRVRFWERTHDVAVDEEVVILTEQHPRGSSNCELGHLRALKESDVRTHATDLSGLDPVVVDAPLNRELDPFEKLVGMGGRARVSVPVTAGSTMDAVLACDWRGRSQDLDARTAAALRLIGAQIGSFLALDPIRHDVRPVPPADERPSSDVETLVIDVAERVRKRIDAATAAVFRFEWPGQRLKKVKTLVAPGRLRQKFDQQGDFDEIYPAGGEHLTGKAWVDPNYHHIVSVKRVEDKHEVWLAPDSMAWHKALLDEIRSVLYVIVGGEEQRYLIRFMNRAGRPELPFLSEATLVRRLVVDLRSEIDAAIALRRLDNLQQLSVETAANELPDTVLQTVGRSLAQESVEDFVICCHQSDGAHLSYHASFGPTLGHLDLGLPRRWRDEPLYRDALRRPFGAVSLARYSDPGRSKLGSALANHGQAVLCEPISAGYTRGVLFVPLAKMPRTRKGSVALPDRMSYGTASLLHAYSRLLANAVETELSRERVLGALQSYGLLGHEVRRPVAGIQSAGRGVLSANRRALRMLPEGPERLTLEERTADAHEHLLTAERRLASALLLSKLVARESEGKLRLRFEQAELSNVVRRAIDEVNTQVRDDAPLAWSTYIDLRSSAEDLGHVVCDAYYLERVLANILTNAVKYSVPRRRSPGVRDSTRILVFGGHQEGSVVVIVRNWGWEIPEHMSEAIFAPFVRGDAEGADVPGMGLGLHLARRLVAAHEGEISFSCRPTDEVFLPRPTRDERPKERPVNTRQRVPIYLTEFQIRVPDNLEPGSRTHVWNEDADRTGGDR